jgi:isoleucyl-tRNA synthetase
MIYLSTRSSLKLRVECIQTVDLLPEKHKAEADALVRGTDTMDVWFDSGSSWAAVCNQDNDLSFPADLYMEGSDQHRCSTPCVSTTTLS